MEKMANKESGSQEAVVAEANILEEEESSEEEVDLTEDNVKSEPNKEQLEPKMAKKNMKEEANLKLTTIMNTDQGEEEVVADGMKAKGTTNLDQWHGGKEMPTQKEMKKVEMAKEQRERLTNTKEEHEDTEVLPIEAEEKEVAEENSEDEVREVEAREVVAVEVEVAEVEDTINRSRKMA